MARSAHVDRFTIDNLPPPEQWPDLVFDLPELGYPAQLNCAQALSEGPDAARPCLISNGQTWSWGRTRETVDRIAHVLVDDLGVVPGGRVLLRGPNTAWLAAAWLAVVEAGGVVVATMPLYRAELDGVGDGRHVLGACDPAAAR